LAAPGFGRYFTDHMVRIDWTAASGWGGVEVMPYGPLTVDPASSTLHYGQAIFEGLKAYRQPDGSVATFRPDFNAERFQRSARRLAMAELPADLFVESLRALAAADREWVPDDPEESLYFRPVMFATEASLMVRPSNSYTYLLIASPAGAYFPHGLQPVSVWLSTEYTRAVQGGTGSVKCAANYAASLAAQAYAAQHGCDQVVWLDAKQRRWVEEMGSNNLYFVYGSGHQAHLVTPKLTGTLLPGATRDSLLTLAADLGYTVEERDVTIDEWHRGNVSGEISEVFACGTAAVITPVGTVKSATAAWTIGDGEPGPITMQLRRHLVAIQTGQAPDTHGWMHPLL
jgi:branched-chain amino acid aminotransferase